MEMSSNMRMNRFYGGIDNNFPFNKNEIIKQKVILDHDHLVESRYITLIDKDSYNARDL